MKLAELFQDHMVIQRDKPFFIWGTGEDGEEVRVTVGQETRETRVKAKQWKLEFEILLCGSLLFPEKTFQ